MRTYGQHCPIAGGAEIFAERWTPIIMRNILLGCTTFTQIQRGAPGIPRSLLGRRLSMLERHGIIERRPLDHGRGAHYLPTEAGKGLWDVCVALGEWGARWLEVRPRTPRPLRRSLVDGQQPRRRASPRPARRRAIRLPLPDKKDVEVLAAARARTAPEQTVEG